VRGKPEQSADTDAISYPRANRLRGWAAALVSAVSVVCVVAMIPVFAQPAASATTRKISAWIPYWNQTSAYDSFLANADLYDEVLPFWYEMQSSTSLTAYSEAEDPTVIVGVKAIGERLVPTVSNTFDGARVSKMLGTSAGRAAHVRTLVNLVIAKGYDGIDIDYENIPATDRNHFTSFITRLASALHHKGKVLDVAVHGKTSEPGTWNGAQAENWAALGKVVDRMQVMSYDYHWNTSEAGPIAPVSWVDQVAAFAVSVVPASKVELGMHLFGYDWVGSDGEPQQWDVMESRRIQHGATKNWDASADESWFTYSMSGTTHTVYYGDGQSVGDRLSIVDKYGLRGAVLWCLGNEDPAVWTAIRTHWLLS